MKKSATATLLPDMKGSEVVVATIFNFYRFYGNKTGSISVIVKTMKKLDKWNATLTLIASTVDEYSSTQKLINLDFTIATFISIFNLLGQALKPKNI